MLEPEAVGEIRYDDAEVNPMASLRIHELPNDVHEYLERRARDSGQSLDQQVIDELRRLPELSTRARRQDVIARVRARHEGKDPRTLHPDPAVSIREDRER